MIEDKLSQDQRIRLEALAQTIAYQGMRQASPEVTTKTAATFEKYIRGEATSTQ